MVVDCRAASTDLFIDFFNEIDLPAMLSAFDAKLTLVMPVNHESDSGTKAQPSTCATEYFGGIDSNLCMGSTIRCLSIISHSLCRASSRKTGPNCRIW